MTTISPARETAFFLLQRWEKETSFADILYREAMRKSLMDARDKCLCGFLFYGTVENLTYIDYLIGSVASVKIKKMHPTVRSVLRVSVFQILFGAKLPIYAVVNDAVNMVSRVNPIAKGMANAILHKLSLYREQEPVILAETAQERLSIRYSHPLALVELYVRELGIENAEKMLQWNNSSPLTEIRVNTLKTTPKALEEELLKEGIITSFDSLFPELAVLPRTVALDDVKAFNDGLFSVQSKASYLSVVLADPKPGEVVVDVCAAPGGKSFAAAAMMKDKGDIYARDLYEGRVNEIAIGAERLGIECIKIRKKDACTPDMALAGKADVVLVDVPCSGLGVIAKKPDIKYKTIEKINELPLLQLKILEQSSNLVKIGGRMIYSTCTINSEENGKVIESFLQRHPEFSREDGKLPVQYATKNGERTLWPQSDKTDGFYYCRMRRIK